jgi:hypothetical protein
MKAKIAHCLHCIVLISPLLTQAQEPESDPGDSAQVSVSRLKASRDLDLGNVRAGSRDWRLRTPVMIGDFVGGSLGLRSDSVQDRLIVLANDLDAPLVLPGENTQLTISEPGPVGIFSSSLGSIQQLQTLLRTGGAIPPAALVETINSNAVLTTAGTISQIQTQLGSTSVPYDIILLVAPPANYDAAVAAVFQSRNTLPGAAVIPSGNAGALLQGGIDTLTGGEDLDAYYFYDYVIRVDTELADAVSGGVGRMKIAEGGSVLPQDRLFFRYNYLDSVRYSNGRQHLNRYVPGFEKTFLNGIASFELRAPFAANTATVSTWSGETITNDEQTRLGNLTMYIKSLLWDNQTVAVSGGLGIVTPTASDTRVNYTDGSPILRISNESVRLQPFLGILYTPGSRLFLHSFIQYDFSTNGNPISVNSLGDGLVDAGVLTDASMLSVDVGAGYWLYRSKAAQRLTGIVSMFEIHQNSGLQAGDVVSAGPFQVGDFTGTTSLTNIVAGAAFEFGRTTQLTAAYVGPLGGGADRQFDGACTLMLNQQIR